MPVEVDRAVKNPVSDLYPTTHKDDFRLDGQPRRRLLSVPKRTTHGLTTAAGSAFVGDATLAIRGFRILGRHPLSIHHLALLRSERLPHGRSQVRHLN